MTDQDYDGSHIKGLILNFVQHWSLPQRHFKETATSARSPCGIFVLFRWPSLFKLPGFMTEFVTPIVGASLLVQPGPLTFGWQASSDRAGEGQPAELHPAVLHHAGHLMLHPGLREAAVRSSEIQKHSSPQQRSVKLSCFLFEYISVSLSFDYVGAPVFQSVQLTVSFVKTDHEKASRQCEHH